MWKNIKTLCRRKKPTTGNRKGLLDYDGFIHESSGVVQSSENLLEPATDFMFFEDLVEPATYLTGTC